MLLLVVICGSCYFHYKKYRSKQEHLIPFYDTSNKTQIIEINSKFKDIGIKTGIYYFFDDMINIKNLDPVKIRIDEKSYKHILAYYIGYMVFKDLR